jgi:hypothetical protein
MAPSATVTLTETAATPLPVRSLKTNVGAYKELASSRLDEETERQGKEDYEAAKVGKLRICKQQVN